MAQYARQQAVDVCNYQSHFRYKSFASGAASACPETLRKGHRHDSWHQIGGDSMAASALGFCRGICLFFNARQNQASAPWLAILTPGGKTKPAEIGQTC